MGIAAPSRRSDLGSPGATEVTLWELVWAISEAAVSDREVVETVLDLLESGRVRLCGSFRDGGISRA
jgi:hypothetical protein